MFSTKPLQSAGKYSYSFYLVHAAILTTLWFAMGVPSGHVGWLVRARISVAGIVAGMALVYNISEKPSLKWIHSKG